MVIRWFLLVLILSVSSFAQFDKWLDKKPLTTKWQWNAVTGSSSITETDVFLYGSFTRTVVPKDSNGTQSASKYIAIQHDYDNSEILVDGGFSNDANWYDAYDQIQGGEFNAIDEILEPTIPVILQAGLRYSLYVNFTLIGDYCDIRLNPNIQTWRLYGDTTLTIQLNDDAYFNFYCGTENIDFGGTIDSISLKLQDYSDSVRTLVRVVDLDKLREGQKYTYYASVLQPNGRYSKGADSTFRTLIVAPYSLTNKYNTSILGQATIEWYDGSIVNEGTIIERKLTVEPVTEFTVIDTVEGNISEYNDIGLEAGTYTWRVKVYRNTDYSAYSDTVSISVNELDLTPSVVFIPDTLEINAIVTEINPLTEQIVFYKNGVNIDSVNYSSDTEIFSDSAITDTSWYKIVVYGASQIKITDSVYIAPIIPALPNPTPLSLKSDTTGIKVIWQDNSTQEDGFIVKRSLVEEPLSYTVLDTVGANVTEYCDSIPTLTANTYFVYQVDAYKGAFTFESNVDTGLAVYYPIDSTFVDADTILVFNPYAHPDSVNYMVIDTIAGSGLLIPVIDSYSSASNGTATFTTLTFNKPASVENGNLQLIMMVTENDTSGATAQYSLTGWTNLGEGGNSTQAARIGILYRIADGTEGSTEVVNINMDNVNALGWWFNISNANTSDIFNTSNFTQSGGNASTHIIPALTTDADSCLAIAGLSFDGADYTGTLTNGWAWRTNQDTLSAYYGSGVGVSGIWGSRTVLSAGSTGVDTITVGVSDGAAYFMLAINGAGGSATYDTTFYYIDTTYSYELLAFNCAEGEVPVPPDKVTGLDTVFANSTQINLIWNDLDDETGYRIEYAVKTEAESEFLIADYNTADDTTYTITGLSAETEYYVRVLAYNLNGNGEYSDTIVTITRATPPIVEGTIIEADYYFDAENGNDSNDGLTPSTAKQGVTGFNNLNLTAGTIVAFRDSMTYRASTSSALGGFYISNTENGTSTNPITITNWYGASSDSFPVFDGSLLITNTWTNTSGNIWQTTVPRAFSGYVRAVWFTMEASPDSIRWGSVRQGGTGYMVKEFDCYGASGSTTLYIYSPSDPNTRYKKVEYMPYAGTTSDITQTMCVRGDYINFQYLDFTKANYDGMYITSYSTGVNVYDCNFYYNGASWYFDTGNIVGGDNGNGIEIHGSYSTVKRCLFMENGSHGYSIYGNNGNIPTRNTVDSSLFINNHHTNMVDINNQSQTAYQNGVDTVIIRWNRSYVTEYFPYDQDNPEIHSGNMWMSRDNSSEVGLTNNIIFANNLVYGGDPCINVEVSVNQLWIYNNTFIHPDPSMSYVWYGTQNNDDMHFFNNIGVSFYTYPAIARSIIAPTNPPKGNVIWMVNATSGWYSGVVPPNNYTDTNPLFNGYNSSTVIWNVSDIDFNSYVDERFTLQSTSPARNYGIDATTVWDSGDEWNYNKSLNGVTRTSTWDAGCYQYVP